MKLTIGNMHTSFTKRAGWPDLANGPLFAAISRTSFCAKDCRGWAIVKNRTRVSEISSSSYYCKSPLSETTVTYMIQTLQEAS